MLEHDMKRLKNENFGLKFSLDKAERLVYGTVQTSQHHPVSNDHTKAKSITIPNKIKLTFSKQSSDKGEHFHNINSNKDDKRGKTDHPPWRSGNCNCSCKASWCRCLGHGASVTS
jgi:hypothetical protein